MVAIVTKLTVEKTRPGKALKGLTRAFPRKGLKWALLGLLKGLKWDISNV